MEGTRVYGFDANTVIVDVNGEEHVFDAVSCEDLLLRFSDKTILRIWRDQQSAKRWRMLPVRVGSRFKSIQLDGDDEVALFETEIRWVRESYHIDAAILPATHAALVGAGAKTNQAFPWGVYAEGASLPFAAFDCEGDAMLFAASREILVAARSMLDALTSGQYVEARERLRIAVDAIEKF